MMYLNRLSVQYAVSTCLENPMYRTCIAVKDRSSVPSVVDFVKEIIDAANRRVEEIIIFGQSNGARFSWHNGSIIEIRTVSDRARANRYHLVIASEDIPDELMETVVTCMETFRYDREMALAKITGVSVIPKNPVRDRLEIKIKYHDSSLEKIERLSTGDWIDLRSAENVELKVGDNRIISLGVSMKLPDGYEAHIVPRSSTYKKWGIIQTNHMGVIDNSYSGDNDIWGMPVLAMRDTVIRKNDRLCQFRIVKKMPDVQFVEVEHTGDIDRGGFGSTGTN